MQLMVAALLSTEVDNCYGGELARSLKIRKDDHNIWWSAIFDD